MTFGWVFLAAAVLAYGAANFLQAVAAGRVDHHDHLHPGLLLRLATHKTYLVGLGAQFTGFLFAFLARAYLPLFLVQSAVAAGLGVTAILGVLLMKWRHPPAEIALLVLLGAGLAGLIISAAPSVSHNLGVGEVVSLAASVALIGVLGRLAARLRGAAASVALGSLAGLSFGAVAVASRPLANSGSAAEFVTNPLLYILLAHSVVGQLLLGLAMQRGSTTAAVAAMDAASAIPAAAIGLLVLGDKIAPGLEWLAAIGFVATLGAVIGLTRYAHPQEARPDVLRDPRRPPISPAGRTAADADHQEESSWPPARGRARRS